MSNAKILIKDRVLTRGSGKGRRVVLDYDSGLIYKYHSPDEVIACFEPGKGWITLQKPYYSTGGCISNARSLLRSINATILELNSEEFLTNAELLEVNASIRKANFFAKKQKTTLSKVNLDLGELELKPELKLRTIERTKSIRGIDPIETYNAYKNALEVFTSRKGKARKIDTYLINKDVVKQGDVVIAFRDSENQIFLNSQLLNVTKFEREFMGGESLIQNQLKELATFSIPFNVLASANLKLNETKVIEQGPESRHVINGNERHFTGALLLANNNRKFLMDIDRVEIENGIFNAFFVEVNSNVNSITEAYDSMKPQKVKDAEKAGIRVKRQGEWFFIETKHVVTVSSRNVLQWDNTEKANEPRLLRHNVSHGKGRPNSLYRPMGFGELDQFVCGKVNHSGREHGELDLGHKIIDSTGGESWNRVETREYSLWELVPNTTISNFTITGDVD